MERAIFLTVPNETFNKVKTIDISTRKYFVKGINFKGNNVIAIRDIIVAVVLDEKSTKISKLLLFKDVSVKLKRKKLVIDFANVNNMYDLSTNQRLTGVFEDFLFIFKNFLEEKSHKFIAVEMSILKKWNKTNFPIIKEELEKIFKSSLVEIPAFQKIFGSSKISMDILSRHFLVVGETGSGKTYSVLFPVIDSLKTKIGNYSALIIDPKMDELKNRFLQNIDDKSKEEYVIDILNNNMKIDIFEGLRNEPIEKKLEYLFRISPRYYEQSKNTTDSYWAKSSRAYISSLITIDDKIRKKGKGNLFLLIDDIMEKLIHKCSVNLIYFPNTLSKVRFAKIKASYFHKLKALSKLIAQMHITFRDDKKILINFIQDELYKKQLPQIEFFGEAPIDTFTSITSVAEPFFEDWTGDIIESILWSDPFETSNNVFSIEKAINEKKVIIFSIPSANISEEFYRIGKIIKDKFFSFCFTTYEYRKENNIPVFYIADEFHRFITGDEKSGEQNFLDRCRGYNVSCIMATQSISSLMYGIKENTGFSHNDLNSSLDIVLNNCCTKFFFRTTDIETNLKLKSIIPSMPYPEFSNYGHVIDVFPVSSLMTGECYYVTSNGKWGKSKITIKPPKKINIKKLKKERRIAA